jgi:hypothetical protein
MTFRHLHQHVTGRLYLGISAALLIALLVVGSVVVMDTPSDPSHSLPTNNDATLRSALASVSTPSSGIIANDSSKGDTTTTRAVGTQSDPNLPEPDTGFVPGGTASAPASSITAEEISRIQTALAPDFEIFRRRTTADDKSPSLRTAISSNGERLAVSINEHGLCLASYGGTVCGAPQTASTVATVAHAVDRSGEQISGIVPDNVALVRVTTELGKTIDVPVRDNVFVTRIPTPDTSSTIAWVFDDGSAVKKVG